MKKDCPNQKENQGDCNCTYHPCPRKGVCCECIAYHRQNAEIPACFFSPGIEKNYNRSIANFIKTYR